MSDRMHATCVAMDDNAVLILGASGAGKSSLGLSLMALGGVLVSDDQTVLSAQSGALIASCPDPLFGLIEARNVGMLRVPTAPPCAVTLVVDMDHTETDRLPVARTITLAGIDLPLLYRVNGPQFASAIAMILKFGYHPV